MSAAVLTINTNMSFTMAQVYGNPDNTFSFSLTSQPDDRLYVLDDDGVFDDGTADTNQVVAPKSTIFADGTAVGSRHKFIVTPDNGDPAFQVYLVFEASTANNDSSAINTLDYALISETPLQTGVSYSISAVNSIGTVNYSNFSNLLICFGKGVRMATPHGQRAVERLCVGDAVVTKDHGARTIRWIGFTDKTHARHDDPLKPICVKEGALAPGVPGCDLIVSRQHRILLRGEAVRRMFQVPEVLAPAFALADMPGIRRMQGIRRMRYYHLLLARHEIVFAEGAETESFFPGPTSLKMIAPALNSEILTLFPKLRQDPVSGYGPPARRLLTPRETRALVDRMLDNRRLRAEPELLRLRA